MKKKAVIIGAGYGGQICWRKRDTRWRYTKRIRQPVGGFRWSSKMDLPSILARHGI